jgi:CxxC motif-containing protein (DUF1111 family)
MNKKIRLAKQLITRICGLLMLSLCAFSHANTPTQLPTTATASTNFQPASLAVDGNQSSRWESTHGATPSWLTVDLGDTFTLSQVIIDWEAANASNYKIEGSNDNNQWTTLSSFTGGAFGNRTDTTSLSGDYRYLRMYATARSAGNYWGYSIFEIKVFGSPIANDISGANQFDGDSAEFFINSSSYADIHYLDTAGLQQNVRMTQSGGRNTFMLNSLVNEQVVNYYFTYWEPAINGQLDTAWQSYTHTSAAVSDSDGDSVSDSVDQCPNTPTGATVDETGCPSDSDGDNILNGLDNCANTPFGATVDASGCPSDSDGDNVLDGIDQCASTPVGATVNLNGCPSDSDDDGVFNGIDQCDNTPLGATVNSSGCPLDSDNDGIFDGIDQCINTPSGANVDSDGCEITFSKLSATAAASSAFQAASLAVDDDQATRWESTHGVDPSTLTLDLSGTYQLTEVIIYWEAANAGSYSVQGSLDGIQWTDLATVNNGNFGDRTDNHIVSGIYQYVRMRGTSRSVGNYWGYSIFEMEVYGSPATPVPVADSDNDGVADNIDLCPNTPEGDNVDSVGCTIIVVPIFDEDGDGVIDSVDQCAGTPTGTIVNTSGCPIDFGAITPLYSPSTILEPITTFVRSDGVVVTRFGDRGRDRHAKDIGRYDPNNIFNSDHYDHWLAHYWEYRTARVQFEDHVANGQSLIRVNYITESQLSAREFRVWFSGVTTTGQFHFNPSATYLGRGTWNNDFEKISDSGHQFMYTVDITEQWKNVATFNTPLQLGVNMEFEISQFLAAPPAGARKNYYGTSYVYIIGQAGMAPFEWDRNARDPLGSNDGTPIVAEGLLGGAGTLGYNYSEEPAGRFIEMATNLAPGNAQPFVEGRRVHHTNFEDGSHDERLDNPIWTEQIGKLGNHYINDSCADCHVRNGRALVAEPGEELDKWVFKVGSISGQTDPLIGRILQPKLIGNGSSEGSVTLGPWTQLANGLRKPNYVFSGVTPARFSARIAPQLVGLGLLDAVSEDVVMEWADPDDIDGIPGISGRVSLVDDPITGETRLGRFGYKASTFSVKHQVASAFNTDMGVMTSMLPSPDCGSAQTDCDSEGSELADEHLNTLTKYIALLGVPARRDLNDSEALQGEMIFANSGCADCHRPTMQTSPYAPLNELRNQTIYPYSDMLLHDMGPGLADNLDDGIATGSEWRTAPLWGLGHAVDVMVRDAKANDTISMAGSDDDINRVGFLHDSLAWR